MDKNVSTWIEGNGTVRTVFRKMALWEYETPEQCKIQLIRAVEKEEPTPSALKAQRKVTFLSNSLPIQLRFESNPGISRV